jgi:hypothetical protein
MRAVLPSGELRKGIRHVILHAHEDAKVRAHAAVNDADIGRK